MIKKNKIFTFLSLSIFINFARCFTFFESSSENSPISEKAVEEEDRYFEELEKNYCGEHTGSCEQKNCKKKNIDRKQNSKNGQISKKTEEVIANESKIKTNQKESETAVNELKIKVGQNKTEITVSELKAGQKKTEANANELKAYQNKEKAIVNELKIETEKKKTDELLNATPAEEFGITCEQKIPDNTKKKIQKNGDSKGKISGFYIGVSGFINNVYVDANLFSITHSPIQPPQGNRVQQQEQLASLYPGSYAYNGNSFIYNCFAFVGYDISFGDFIRLGLELQGGASFNEAEISANGLFYSRTKQYPKIPTQFEFEGRLRDEINLGFTRETIKIPYRFTFLPRLGVSLSKNALLYTKIGFAYDNWQINDNPEIVDDGGTGKSKTTKDTLFDKYNTNFVGAIGLEASLSKKFFLRMECMLSTGPKFSFDLNTPEENEKQEGFNKDITDVKNFQLSSFNVKSSKVFSFGLGGGYRF